MPRYRENERKQSIMVPIQFDHQIQPGTFEHAIDYLVDNEIDLSKFEEVYQNDETGTISVVLSALGTAIFTGSDSADLSIGEVSFVQTTVQHTAEIRHRHQRSGTRPVLSRVSPEARSWAGTHPYFGQGRGDSYTRPLERVTMPMHRRGEPDCIIL